MATWREALDNVRAGNVALANNVRFSVGYYMWSSKFYDTPPIILSVDTSGTTPNESIITFRDGSIFGFGYAGTSSGNFFDLYCFTNIKGYETAGQTVCGTDYNWIQIYNGINYIEYTPIPGETTHVINITEYSLAFVIPVDSSGQIITDDYYMLQVTYPTKGTDPLGGLPWTFNYNDYTPWYQRGEFGYLQSISHVVDFLAGEQAEPEHFPGDPSGSGGGTGWFISRNDSIDLPSFPTIQAIDLGFVSIYNPKDAATCQAIASWLWSDDFDEAIKLNYASPFENIQCIATVPVYVDSTTAILRVGNVDSNIPCPKIYAPNQFKHISCGSINVLEYWGSFLDYNASYSIWLPFIGFRGLRPDDFVNGNLSVDYYVDLLTGNCMCFISATKEDGIFHILYNYTGNVFYNCSFSGANFMAMYNQQLSATSSGISNAIQSLGQIGSSLASGNFYGAAGGLANLITGQSMAQRQYDTAKPDYGRGGNGSGNAGYFGRRKPYLVQSLPIGQPPDNYEAYQGIPSMITAELGDLTGYTEVETVICDTLNKCTQDEKNTIISLLKSGVII